MQQQYNKSNIQHNIFPLAQQSLISSQQRNNINVTYDFPNNKQIHVLCTLSNWTTIYIYNIIFLGFYPKISKTTRRTIKDGPIYTIPDNYMVQLCIYGTEVICLTKYQFNGDVKFTVT